MEAIRENHGVLLLPGQRFRYTTWSTFDRVFSHGDTETRYIRAIIFGQRWAIRYYHITTDVAEQPPESTWFIRTNLPGTMKKTVGNTYGLRTWIAYGFKQSKNELGWADFRLTAYNDIEKWWEMVCSASLMVSLQALIFEDTAVFISQAKLAGAQEESKTKPVANQAIFHQHTWREHGKGWKNILNNLRFIIQPYVYYCLIYGWLEVFNMPFLKGGFTRLIALMHDFTGFVPV